ncbi:MAG: hypothetical protein K6F66_02805, partial [Pseudobutyrivibrio sp.]|nr:hypothetical protein [Pseudobutyrivibrio sp.]
VIVVDRDKAPTKPNANNFFFNIIVLLSLCLMTTLKNYFYLPFFSFLLIYNISEGGLKKMG